MALPPRLAALLITITLAPVVFALPTTAEPVTGGGKAVTKVAALAKVPRPHNPSKAESDFLAYLETALAPLTGLKLPEGDGAKLKDAFNAIAANDQDGARRLQAGISHPVARKLITWKLLREGIGTPSEFRAFLAANPAWADRKTLMQRAEEALFVQGGSSQEIKSFFAGEEPVSGVGFAALASALLVEGDKDGARRMAAKAWREMDIPAALEAGFLARFSGLLTLADHKWRVDRLLIDTIRWEGAKKSRAAVARRTIALMPPEEQKKANARLGVLLGSKAAKKSIEGLAVESDPDWGLVFHRIQALRRTGKTEEAAKLLLGAPTEEALIVSPDEWWVERRANAYEALKRKKPKLAYELVREAGPLSVNPLKEQSFMAGWIALRYLKDAKLAEPHFRVMEKAADGPLSRAKAAYWLGRVAEARKDRAAAEEYYRAAQRDPDAFHALLARQKLEPGRQRIAILPPQRPSSEEAKRFVDLDAAQAVIVAKKAGLDVGVTRAFLTQLRIALKSEAEAAMIAQLAEAIGDTQQAVRTGKTAIGRAQNLHYYAYPVHPFPAYTPLRNPPEPAMLLGLARQETEFNTSIISGAGAKGLLQVMTITAKHVCRDYKIKCDISRLLTDPAYNTMLASAYVGDRMRDFDGSYILTLVGYNAGPGRARQWIREFGDPRDPNVDPIDWIERIPIQETREYVAKVLANVQIYRARLGEEAALRLDEDLVRARAAVREAGRDNPDG
jgi:soluble lytic murein transglycosylase